MIDNDCSVLVTGARGFIGVPLTRLLAARGYRVHATTRRALPLPAGSGSSFAWRKVDLMHSPSVAAMMSEIRPHVVIHLAWGPVGSWEAPANLEWAAATLNLAKHFAACGGRRFIGAGTCAEYEWSDAGSGAALDEVASIRRPKTLYGAAKNGTFEMLSAFFEQKQIDFAWGVVFHPYGPGENGDSLVPYVIRSLLAGEPALCTAGHQRRDFVYLADVAEALAALVPATACRRMNIATGTGMPVGEVASRIGELLDRTDLIKLDARPERDADVVGRVGRLVSEVGWVPKVSLEEGLRRTVDWWRERCSSCDQR